MTIANFKPKEAQPITPQIWTDFLNHKNFDHVEQGEKAKLPVGPQAKKKIKQNQGRRSRQRPKPHELARVDLIRPRCHQPIPIFFSSDAS
jgi:hypothetical protein